MAIENPHILGQGEINILERRARAAGQRVLAQVGANGVRTDSVFVRRRVPSDISDLVRDMTKRQDEKHKKKLERLRKIF